VDNALTINTTALQFQTDAGTQSIDLPFSTYQEAVGQSAATTNLVYDSLGIPCGVTFTAVLESRDGNATTYRWFADSSANAPPGGEPQIAVGTGLIQFDGDGNFIGATSDTISIYRGDYPSTSPLTCTLHFDQLSGLAEIQSAWNVKERDGSAPQSLVNFTVAENGTITGVFSQGTTRPLGQIRLVRFSNPAGLNQKGQNVFVQGVNSGLPMEGNPGERGIGSIIAGAVELSNADIGSNLIDLITASTMYRSNTRTISTAQQMIDELLSLRR
jgi:flagellar hook protein FlgE